MNIAKSQLKNIQPFVVIPSLVEGSLSLRTHHEGDSSTSFHFSRNDSLGE